MQHDTIYAIGEALIDFIPQESGCDFSQVTAFSPALGGAPVNVCGAVAKLGGRSQMITQVGDDPFGHKILREMGEAGIGPCFHDSGGEYLSGFCESGGGWKSNIFVLS